MPGILPKSRPSILNFATSDIEATTTHLIDGEGRD